MSDTKNTNYTNETKYIYSIIFDNMNLLKKVEEKYLPSISSYETLTLKYKNEKDRDLAYDYLNSIRSNFSGKDKDKEDILNNENELEQLALSITLAIKDKWCIGNFSRFCDEPPDFDSASTSDVIKLIIPILKTLNKKT